MKRFSEVILREAGSLLTASKSLNYQRIVNHEPEEIAKLKEVVASLSIKLRNDESLNDYASQPKDQATHNGFDDDLSSSPRTNGADTSEQGATLLRRKQIIDSIEGEGFGDREGLVYNSFASSRSSSFKQVPHMRGLPDFDLVIAPDFTPVSGLHGIFITDHDIKSMILPSDNSSSEWQLMKSKDYANKEELIEFLTLIAAGFDLP